MKHCSRLNTALKLTRRTSASPTDELTGSTTTSRQLEMLSHDFMRIYGAARSNGRDMLSMANGIANGMRSVNDLISNVTGGKFKRLSDVVDTNNKHLIEDVSANIRRYMEQLVLHEKNNKAIYNVQMYNVTAQIMRGYALGHKLAMFSTKAFSGQWIPYLNKFYDALIVDKAYIFRQNPIVDRLRAFTNTSTNSVEGRTTQLRYDFEKIFMTKQYGKDGLSSDTVATLLKYYDADKRTEIDTVIKAMIEDGDIKKDKDTSVDARVLSVKTVMEGIFNQWKMFNYGTTTPKTSEYFSNWQKYRGSYVHHIIASGVEYVNSVRSAIDNGITSGSFLERLSDREREVIKLFGFYAVHGNKEQAIKLSRTLGGIQIDEEHSFHVKSDYVPYLEDDQIANLFTVKSQGVLTWAKMLSERRGDRSGKEVDVITAFSNDIESYRGMMTQANDRLFARQLQDYMTTQSYVEWAIHDRFTDEQLKMHAQYMSKDLVVSSSSVNKSRHVELTRQLTLMSLGLVGTSLLMVSGVKNLVLGALSLTKNITSKDAFDRLTGDRSLNVLESSKLAIGNTMLGDVVKKSVEISKVQYVGRSDIHIIDTAQTTPMNKTIQFVMDKVVDRSKRYGVFMPFVDFMTDSMRAAFDGKGFLSASLTAVGSERLLRSWGDIEFANFVSWKFQMDKAVLDNKDTSPKDRKAIMDRWKDDNAIRKTVSAMYEDATPQLYEKNNKYFGDFSQDVKPIWVSKQLREGDTMMKVALGGIATAWYMFRQAVQYDLNNTLVGVGRMISTVLDFKHADRATPVMMPLFAMMLMGMDFYDLFSSEEDEEGKSVGWGFLQAANSLGDIATIGKGITLGLAAFMDFPLQEQARERAIAQLARYGGGVLAGNALESIYADIHNDLAPFTNMLASIKNYGSGWTTFASQFVASSIDYDPRKMKQAMRDIYNIKLPLADTVLGGGNDLLRTVLDAMYASKSMTTDKNADRQVDAISNFMQDIAGSGFLEVRSVYNGNYMSGAASNARLAANDIRNGYSISYDVDFADDLDALSKLLEDSINGDEYGD